jgi:hypothetical protein
MSVGGVMNPDSLAETRQAPVEKTDPTGAYYATTRMTILPKCAPEAMCL